jgi:hypothetical protein
MALMLAIPLLTIAPAAAAPLDAEVCKHLQSQLDTLRTEGATADMARGPEWARANLPLERLQRIGTLIEVEEQLNFRCGLARITLPTTIEGGEEELPGAGEATIEGTGNSIALPQRPPGRPAAAATTTVPKAAAPKAPAARAPAPKPAIKKEPVKAAPPKKAPEKVVQPAPEGAQPKKKAPAQNQNKSQKKQPQADDAYRPSRPITSEGNWAPVIRQ